MKKLNIAMSILLLISINGYASISVDRTRVIYDEESKGVSVVVENKDNKDPYLLQSWIEDSKGKKISSPLIALPLLQRIEPTQKKQVRISTLNGETVPASDKETLFYFNVLGIPPKSKLENAVEIVIQSRFKLFYRPKNLEKYHNADWQKELILKKNGNKLTLINPTQYHIVVININDSIKKAPNFKEMIVSPKNDITYELTDKQRLSSDMIITYIDDYGSSHFLKYKCSNTQCNLVSDEI